MKQLQRLPAHQPSSHYPSSSSSHAIAPDQSGTAIQVEAAASREFLQANQPCLSCVSRSPVHCPLLRREEILMLHRTIGNKAVGRLLRAGQIREQQQSLDLASGGQPGERETAPQANHTGLPDALKARVERLSGISLDDVRVHYHSTKPAQVQALAYTQGTQIYVAPGQEEHLAHETWHVVQQKQGRVQPTMQMNEARVNGDEGLEREADVMGEGTGKIGQGVLSPAHSFAHLPIVSSGLAPSQNAFPTAEGKAAAHVIQRKPVYYHQKGKETDSPQNSYRDTRDEEPDHIFEEDARDIYKFGSMTLYYDEQYDQYTTDVGDFWDPVTGKLFTIDEKNAYIYYDRKGNMYQYKKINGEYYYEIVENTLEESDFDEEEDPTVKRKRGESYEEEERKGQRQKTGEEGKKEVAYVENKPGIADVDRAIEDRFDIHEQDDIYYFYPKGVQPPKSGHRGNDTDEPTAIGMISWDIKNDTISFDVSKFDQEDKKYPGIGYAMIYYLLKQNSDYPMVSIEVFQSKQDITSLENWYKGMGFGNDFTADTAYVRDNCKRLYAQKG